MEANGAIPPLVCLLSGPLQHEHSALTLEAAQTAAWALSNLLHGSGRQVSTCGDLTLDVSSLSQHCSSGFALGRLAKCGNTMSSTACHSWQC